MFNFITIGSEKGIIMNTNITQNRVNPQFGHLYISSPANKFLVKKLKNPANWQKLDKLEFSQSRNPVDVRIFADYSGFKLTGIVSDNTNIYREYEQSIFSAIFSNPLKFIKRLCKDADSIYNQYYK